ncbi:NTPase KAP (plasmid) [Roseomonas sp. FDAARGOS_362]|uniref:KAP family P-loop NTPase fold protein n=1 Tax=Roseomonas sp. FDAARGOS_362 TaxID=2018065 RepID=UPI000C17BCA9|nr:P-loop NTPase fold protein [Roseomonas sp. FDAARGOS_362]ATR19155.1 NTPase KAP [Roseomonas sp. FDAARGOS_362]
MAVWADIDTKQDFLNYGEAAVLVAEVIQDERMLPTSIGVLGTWGTGKSSLLNIIEAELRADSKTRDAIVVRFNAWLYQGYDDAKAALMETVADALIAAAEHAEDKSLPGRAMELAGRVRWFRAAGVAAEVGAAFAGIPLFGAARAAAAAGERLLEGGGTEDDLKKVREGAKEVGDRAKGLISDKAKRTPPREIDEFKAEFGKVLGGLKRTLVVFVDNLDRCMPEQTIRTLEAMRLFLSMHRTAFVVAADEEMVRQSVRAHFANIGERHVTDYLDKLIQIPVRVPRLGVREVRAYLFQLLADAERMEAEVQARLRKDLTDNLQAAWRDDPISVIDVVSVLGLDPASPQAVPFSTADRIAPLLAMPPVNGNPRLIKRMLNVVRMRARLARRRSMPVSEDIIAKVALFERCMSEDATKAFYALIQAAEDGQIKQFAVLEGLTDEPAAFVDALPESWKREADLLRAWFALEPKVSGDLRPIAYLGRDTAALSVQKAALSQAGRSALAILLGLESRTSHAARKALEAVPQAENVILMEAVTAEMRKEVDWSTQPKGWWGALLLSEHDPSTLVILQRVIGERAGEKPPAWLRAANRASSVLPGQGRS